MFDEDITDLARPWLSEGAVTKILDSQAIFQVLEERFPIGANRIAWGKVTVKRYEEIFPVATGGKTTNDVEERLSARAQHVRMWLQDEGIAATTEVVWIGDSTDLGLSMHAGTLLECFPKLFSLPQHSYVLPRDGSWCLNYVMEGQLFFARSLAT